MSVAIESVTYLACGSCKNQLSLLFKGHAREERVFEAGVFLLEHPQEGYILYDTGYSAELNQNKLKYWLYRALNPISVKESDQVDQLLKEKGIDPLSVKHLILSHLHPDHIGRVKAFPNAQIYLTQACFQAYQENKVSSLIFKEFLPVDFEERLVILRENQPSFIPGKNSVDLFSDGAIEVLSLDGHAKGQACLYLAAKQLFIGADVAWGMELLDLTDEMRFLPSLIQDDLQAYKDNSILLQDLRQQGVKIVVSHDEPAYIQEVLHESYPLS